MWFALKGDALYDLIVSHSEGNPLVWQPTLNYKTGFHSKEMRCMTDFLTQTV
jgi:hypothetical protein